MTNIILCGGSGTRLWPISRTLMPKQFVKLFEGKSLFQLTVERNSKVCDSQFVVSNAEQYFLALDQLEELHKTHNRYLLEPVGRNTAPAIALACMALDYDEIVLVTPSDHLIKDEKEYKKVLKQAQELAKQDNLVTFGITPTFPETGFSYIEGGDIYPTLDIIPKIKNESVEIYHYTNEGVLSWYDFAKEIMRMAKLDCQINPIETKAYPTPATRPHFSLLNKSKIKEEFGIIIPYWKDSLDECLTIMGERK